MEALNSIQGMSDEQYQEYRKDTIGPILGLLGGHSYAGALVALEHIATLIKGKRDSGIIDPAIF